MSEDRQYEEDGDDALIENTATYRRHMLLSGRKTHSLVKKHETHFDGDTSVDPPKPGVLRDISRIKTWMKAIIAAGGIFATAGLGALAMHIITKLTASG